MTLQALGSSVHKAADLADMLLFKLVHFLMLVVELLQLEGARTKFAGIIEFRTRRRHPGMVDWLKCDLKLEAHVQLRRQACDREPGQRPLRN